jgi:hemerythrin
MLKWKTEFETGISHLDQQHKHLFEIGNKAYSLLDDEMDRFDEIVAVIGELKDYTIYHFTSEEEYMKSIGYRKFFSHKVAHDDFIKKVSEIDFEKLDENQEEYVRSIIGLVFDWVTEHILGKDMEYAAK